MSRTQCAEPWHHTRWTYRRRALTHYTQAAAFILPIAVGAITLSAIASLLCFVMSELMLVLALPHFRGFRLVVDEHLRRPALIRAVVMRAGLVSRMDGRHREELERLEDLVGRVRALTACDGRSADDWLGLDNLLAVFVRLAIVHRESATAFEPGGAKQLEVQLAELEAASATGDATASSARRAALLRDRLAAWHHARKEQALLVEELATMGEIVRWTYEQVALGRSSDAQAGVAEAIANCARNRAALRELAALRGDGPIDAEALRLGRQREIGMADANPQLRVDIPPHTMLDVLLADDPTARGGAAHPACARFATTFPERVDASQSLRVEQGDMGTGARQALGYHAAALGRNA